MRKFLNGVYEIGCFALLCWVVWRSALCFLTREWILTIPVTAILHGYVIPIFQEEARKRWIRSHRNDPDWTKLPWRY